MNFRKAIFWAHLVCGVVIGAVIFTMAVTGITMAFQRQMISAAEREVSTVATSGSDRLTLATLVGAAQQSVPNAQVSGVTIRSASDAAVLINLGRDRGVFVDPYRGVILGSVSKWRSFLHQVEQVHRNLALGPTGRAVTGASALGFLGLVVSGVYLWWPRKWSISAWKSSAVPSLRLRGKARNWNWHNAIGFWSALPLILVILTGLVMAYPWANNLLFRLSGNEPPPPRPAAKTPREAVPFDFAQLDQLWARAEQQVAGWQTINIRLPDSATAPVTFVIDKGDGTRPNMRAQLALNVKTGEVVRWEPFETQNRGRQLRMWVKPVHTGEAGGLIGQGVAMLVAASTAMLVWTGFALAWRRFRNRARATRITLPAAEPSVEFDVARSA